MAKFKNLKGLMFGRLIVLELSHKQLSGNRDRYYWLCQCECGNFATVRTDGLTSGNVKSCGCLHKETAIEHVSKHHKHKMSGTNIYSKWLGMKSRCFNKNTASYPRYGGRGINIYSEWVHDFQAFYDYVSQLEHYGEEGYSLDRIDNNGNYAPNNLRWANHKTQCHNRRSNLRVDYKGNSKTAIEVAIEEGINYGCLIGRLHRNIEHRNPFRPVGCNAKYIVQFNDKNYTFKEIATIANVSLSTIYQRYKSGKRGAELFKSSKHRGKHLDSERLNDTVERSE